MTPAKRSFVQRFPSDRNGNRELSLAIVLLSVVFFVKATYLAFFVTPLWDIPDEIGHLAYVMHIVAGEGLPVLGKAMIPPEIMSHVRQLEGAAPAGNWIAQHPPLYYYVAAVPYWITQQFTSDVEVLYRIPRVIAALCGALLLLVLYRTCRLLKLSDRGALCLAGCVGWIPMFSHMASGTNHDVPLFLAGALSAHFLARFVLQHDVRDAYIAAVWLSIAGAMKMTAWVLLPPFVLVIAWELRGNLRAWVVHLSGTTAVAVSAPTSWMIRNFIEYGNPTYTAETGAASQPQARLQHSFFEYISTQPVIDHFLLHFYGLFGWIGTGGGNVVLHQVGGLPRTAFTIALLAVAISLLLQFFVVMRQPLSGNPSRFAHSLVFSKYHHTNPLPCARLLVVITAIGVFAMLTYFSMKGDYQVNVRLLGISTILAMGAGACIGSFIACRDDNRLFMYGIAIFFSFTLAVLINVYDIYLVRGWMGAIHGRYFYPVLPWLLIPLCLALTGRAWGERMLIMVFPLLVIAEADAYINQILPFYSWWAK